MVETGNKVTFKVHSPNAQSVAINGSWMGYGETAELKKGPEDVWSVTLGPFDPSMYHYNFFIDGVSAIDPKNPHALRDGVRYASMLIVPGEGSRLFEVNDVPHGALSKVWYDSPSLGLYRRMYVYTPPGYEESNKRLLDMLEKTGIEHEYFESAGGHTWANWRTYLSMFAPMLF